jgi:signal peptide peptidase SppA
MPYDAIMRHVASRLWAIEPTLGRTVFEVLVNRTAGEKLDEESLAAAIGRPVFAVRPQKAAPDPLVIDGSVAVIPITGIITRHASLMGDMSTPGSTVDGIRAKLQEAIRTPSVEAIVLHVDSGGGSVDGIADLAAEIRDARRTKPVVAIADETMASAAYWLGAQADRVLATQTSRVGSIGVLAAVQDLSELYAARGVKVHVVRSADKKGIGVAGTQITEEDLAEIQREIDAIHDIFVAHVSAGRGMNASDARGVATGQVWTGRQTLAVGLVDRIGTYRNAVNLAKRLAKERRDGDPEQAALAASLDEWLQAAPAAETNGALQRVAAAMCSAGHELDPIQMAINTINMKPCAAVAAGSPIDSGGTPMPEDTKIESATANDANAAQVEQVQAAAPPTDQPDRMAIEAQRQREIRAMAERYDLGADWALAQITDNATLEQARLAAMDVLHGQRQPVADLGEHTIEVGGDNRDDFFADASDAIVLRARMAAGATAGQIKIWDQALQDHRPVRAGAMQLRHRSLLQMAEQHMQLMGVRGTDRMSPSQIAQLSFNTKALQRQIGAVGFNHVVGDFPYLLADSANKVIFDGYLSAPSTWQQWMQRRTTRDFKAVPINEPGTLPAPPVVREGAEYTYAKMGERQITVQLVKYGQLIGFTWETLVNDDLSVFTDIASELGETCRSLEDDVAYNSFLANPAMYDGTVLFHADHNNLGTAGAISTATIEAAVSAMTMQQAFRKIDTDGSTHLDDGRYLNIRPRYLVTGPINSVAAAKYTGSPIDPDEGISGVPNAWQGLYMPIIEPRVQAYAAGTAYRWYMAAANNTVRVYFLEGNEQPYMEELDNGSVDARTWKVRHVVAATPAHWKGMYANLFTGS